LANLFQGLDQISIYFVFLFGFESKIYQFFSISSIIFGLGISKEPVILKVSKTQFSLLKIEVLGEKFSQIFSNCSNKDLFLFQ